MGAVPTALNMPNISSFLSREASRHRSILMSSWHLYPLSDSLSPGPPGLFLDSKSRVSNVPWGLFFGFRPLSEELHIRSAATSLDRAWDRASPWMEAIMSNPRAAAIEIGAVIAILVAMALVKQRMPVTQPLNREQPLLSATESQRLSDRQQVNRYFLQNWRNRPTRPNFD